MIQVMYSTHAKQQGLKYQHLKHTLTTNMWNPKVWNNKSQNTNDMTAWFLVRSTNSIKKAVISSNTFNVFNLWKYINWSDIIDIKIHQAGMPNAEK